MVSVRHTVVVEPLPYGWLVDALGVVRALVEESEAEGQRLVLPDGRVAPDVRLVQGRHLRPGAAYVVSDEDGEGKGEGTDAGETARITVGEWDRHRAVRLELAVAGDDGTVELDAVLESPDRPRLLEIGGRALTEGAPLALSHLKGRARIRLDDWWTAAGAARTVPSAPVSARLDHRWLRADVRAVPRPRRDDDGWNVRITVSLRGCSFLRPVAAVVLAATGRWTRRTVARALDDAAERWNKAVPRLVAMDSERLREAFLTHARHPGSDDGRT